MRINKLTIICLLCSIAGLLLIYIATINTQPTEIPINEITTDLIGRTITTSGYIVYKSSNPAGHVFLTLSDNNKTKIEIPLFAGFMNSLSEVGITEQDFKEGSRVLVSGLVDQYQGQLQVQPRKASDIQILSD